MLLVCCNDRADARIGGRDPAFFVRVEEGFLTVRLENISLKRVLEEIANQAWIRIVFFGTGDESVTFEFSDIPLEKGLRRIIGDRNHVFIYGQGRLSDVEAGIREVRIFPDYGDGRTGSDKPTVIAPNLEALEENSLETLIRDLEDHDPLVREEIVGRLSEFRDERAFQELTRLLLNDEDEDVRASAAKALGSAGNERAIAPLAEALKDQEAWVRENAVDALGRIGGKRVIPPLMEGVKDQNRVVRGAAEDVLRDVMGRSGPQQER
jgi:hypothetical protein